MGAPPRSTLSRPSTVCSYPRSISLVLVASFCLVLLPTVAFGSSSSASSERILHQADSEQWQPDDLFRALDLHHRPDCQDFAHRAALAERRARWQEAIDLLAQHDERALGRWILGLDDPPDLVLQESTDQLHCLITDLLDHAAQDTDDIQLLPSGDPLFSSHRDTPSRLARAALEDERLKQRFLDRFTRSHHRGFHSQAHIWHRKYEFTGRPFLRITAEAADLCDLPTHRGWQPDDDDHERCWHRHLSSAQRQIQILQASSAPGLSRHHWGTDIDIFRLLTPWVYHEGGPFHHDWRFLDEHALDRGFFQTYDGQPRDGFAHMEEPWHWSYYPIAQAILTHIDDHPDWFFAALDDQWSRMNRQRGGDRFGHPRDHWRDYLFNIQTPTYEARPVPPARHHYPLEVAP